MSDPVHLIKLSVGSDSVESLAAWYAGSSPKTADGLPRHVTRMWPRRADEILATGGSIYWVIRGLIQCRMRIRRFDEVIGADGIRRCAIVLDREIVRTTPVPRRAFQGWRYLAADEAPPDLPAARQAEETLPPELSAQLAEIGVI